MKRQMQGLSVALFLVLFGIVSTGVQAGEMKEKAGMMNDSKMEMMSGKTGDMMQDKKMDMVDDAKKDGMRSMIPATRTGTLSGSKGHSASGRVVLTTGDMGPVLILKEIQVDKVPDGRVFLARDADYGNGVEVGRLQQFQGTVTFPIPADVNTAEFNSVVIWCKKFDVEIGRATLAGEKM